MKKLCTLGDSIAFGYREDLITFLSDELEILTKEGLKEAAQDLNIPVGTNSGDSKMLYTYIDYENNQGRICYDYVMFNCGLHDIKANIETGVQQILIGDYEKNLNKTIDIWEENNVKVFFVNSTPVIDEIHNSAENLLSNKIKRLRCDLLAYNKVAEKVMAERNVPVIDLFSFTDKFGAAAFRDHAHFHPEVIRLQAAYLAGAVKSLIKYY